jgi:aminoglycoside 6'-N-acetyltransferase
VLPSLPDGPLTLRPLAEDDLDRLVAIAEAPGVAEWWSPPRGAEARRDELRNEGLAFAIELDGEVVGWLGFEEELYPDYAHASLDLFLAPRAQDRGLGPAALRLAAGWLVREHGHHRLTIDPAAENARAIRAYEKVGFRPVGRLRQYQRFPDGTWHDGLLMELLAEDMADRPLPARSG